jgi:hypothetical protein
MKDFQASNSTEGSKIFINLFEGSKMFMNLFLSSLEAYMPSWIQVWIQTPNPDQDPFKNFESGNPGPDPKHCTKHPVNTWASSITILKFFGLRNW